MAKSKKALDKLKNKLNTKEMVVIYVDENDQLIVLGTTHHVDDEAEHLATVQALIADGYSFMCTPREVH